MRHCYLCDQEIAGAAFRRSVGMGRSHRVSVGRHVSASSPQRSGLRTLCPACAGRVDLETRLKNKVISVGAILLAGFVIYANTGAHVVVNHAGPVREAGRANPRAAEGSKPAPAPSMPIISPAEAAIVGPGAVGTRPHAAAPPLLAWKSTAAVSWKHKTSEGTRWSLRPLRGGGMALLIDLGGDQVATVLVGSGFQDLGLPEMDRRVSSLRSQAMKLAATSAAYTYTPSGVIRAYP